MAYTDSTPTIVGALLVVLVVLPCLILNILFLVMYGKRKRLRVPTNFMLVSLCATDLVAVILWTIFSVLSAFSGTSTTLLSKDSTLCLMQVIISTWYQLMNMHTFAIFSIERVLRFWKPTLHAECFYNDVVVIVMLVFLWLFEIAMALFPVYGWGKVVYQDIEFQCAFDNTKAASRLNAMMIFNWGIPFLFTLFCFICVFKKYSDLKREIHPADGGLDDDLDYGDKYRGTQLSTRNNLSRAGTGRDPYLGESDSDEETDYNKVFSVVPVGEDDQDKLNGKSQHKYRVRDLDLAITVMIAWIFFILLWLIYIIVQYIYVYDSVLKLVLPDGVATAGMFLSHFTLVLKCIVYFAHNRRFRRHLRAALGCTNKPPPKKEVNVLRIPKDPLYARKNAGGPQNQNIYRQDGAFGMDY
jgi:hypothetical protein